MALRAFVYEAVLGVVLVLGLLALALEVAPRAPLLAEGVQPLGFLLALAGGGLWLWATVVLVDRGEGTPLPLDPPRRLVVAGPYRCVRNPMHLGLVAFFLGEALLFRSIALVAIVGIGAIGLWAYARWREEPVLAERFGARHAVYREAVPAWVPRLDEALPALRGFAGEGRGLLDDIVAAARQGLHRAAGAGRHLIGRARSRFSR